MTKKEVFGIKLPKYLNATKAEKGTILDILERQTGKYDKAKTPYEKALQADTLSKIDFENRFGFGKIKGTRIELVRLWRAFSPRAPSLA